MTNAYPTLRFTKASTPSPRLFYDGPPDQADVHQMSFTVDHQDVVYVRRNGTVISKREVSAISNAAATGAGQPTELAAATCAVELIGSPTLLHASEGYGGSIVAVTQPLQIPEDTPIGALMLIGLVGFDLTRGYQYAYTRDGTPYFDLSRLLDVQRPWVPPGWQRVKFDVTDGGFANLGLVMGVYSRVCQAGDPGSLVNPYGFDFTGIPTALTDPPAQMVASASPSAPQNQGNWVAHLRTYTDAVVRRSRMAVGASPDWDPTQAAELWLNGDPRGFDLVLQYPAIFNPISIVGAAHTVQFFAVNREQGDFFLPNGLVTTPDPPEQISQTEVGQTLPNEPPTGARTPGPLLTMASEDVPNSGSASNALSEDPPIGLTFTSHGTATITCLVKGGPRDLHATMKVEKNALTAEGTVVRAVTFNSDVALTVENVHPDTLPSYTLTDEGSFPPGSFPGWGEEGDQGLNPADPTQVPEYVRSMPVRGPVGPLGPSVSWRTVAHWAGGSLSDFTFPDQMDHGALVPGPTMQVLDGSLTTADKTQVETYSVNGDGNAPYDYHGDKYQAIWTAAGAAGDGSKLRAKMCVQHGIGVGTFVLAGVTLNTVDRESGLAYWMGLESQGWTRDLRLLGTVQYGLDTRGGQNLALLQQAPFGSFTPDVDGLPVAYRWGPNLGVHSVVWVEVWRDGDTIHSAIYLNDPDDPRGAHPVWVDDYIGLSTSYGSSNWGPSTSGYWGVTFDFLDPALKSLSGFPLGLIELTLFQA